MNYTTLFYVVTVLIFSSSSTFANQAKGNVSATETSHKQNPNKQSSMTDRKNYYRIENGDTLSAIALSSGHRLSDLVKWNHIEPPYNKILIGSKLKLFNPEEKKASSTNATEQAEIIGKNQSHEKSPTAVTTTKKNRPEIKINKPTQKPANSTTSTKKPIISTENKKVLKLKFAWPMTGKIIKKFSPPQQKGINIANKALHQPVGASEDGKVVYVGQGLRNLQNLIIIKHNDVYLTAYANNSRVLVSEGQQISKSQIIAEIGDGANKQTTLHFEIRKNGQPLDPLQFLPPQR
jgi:lipoprotein NlpD